MLRLSGKLLFGAHATVGMGLAPSVREAALEPGSNNRKSGDLHISPRLFLLGCTECGFADGRSKPLPYGGVRSDKQQFVASLREIGKCQALTGGPA